MAMPGTASRPKPGTRSLSSSHQHQAFPAASTWPGWHGQGHSAEVSSSKKPHSKAWDARSDPLLDVTAFIILHPQQHFLSLGLNCKTPHTVQFIFPASNKGLEMKLQFGDQRQRSSNGSDYIQGLSQEMWKLRVRNVLIKG